MTVSAPPGVRLVWAAVGVFATILAGCTPYSFSGGRTALVQSVAVPIFENETAEFGLAEKITDDLIDGLVSDNQIRVVDPDEAEASLVGSVVDYIRKAYTFDENDLVDEYIVEIYVSADLVKSDGSGSVWKVPRLRGFGVYPADSAEFMGQRLAIERITEEIINLTIKSW